MLFDLDKSKFLFTTETLAEIYEIAPAFYNPFGTPFYFYKLPGTITFHGPYDTPQRAVEASRPLPRAPNLINVDFKAKKRI